MYNWHSPLNFQGQTCSALHYVQVNICSVGKNNVTDIPHAEICTVEETISYVTRNTSAVIFRAWGMSNLTLREDQEWKVNEIMGQTSNRNDTQNAWRTGKKVTWQKTCKYILTVFSGQLILRSYCNVVLVKSMEDGQDYAAKNFGIPRISTMHSSAITWRWPGLVCPDC
jgi:hypothetical protein